MDWDLAIERNRAALKRVLAMLLAMAGFAGAGSSFSRLREESKMAERQGGRASAKTDEGCLTLPRRLHRAILRLLRPAESAARRLVIVFARNVEVTPSPMRPRKPKPNPTILRNGVGTGIVMPAGYRAGPSAKRTLLLPLADRLHRLNRQRRAATGCAPRILFPGFAAPSPVRLPPMPSDLLDATRLAQRLAALAAALDDLPAHARRFARWRARRDAGRIRRPSPLRAGKPPGQRSVRSRQPAHEVHDLLNDIHGLAFWALEPADTS